MALDGRRGGRELNPDAESPRGGHLEAISQGIRD
jgi:hypothetical protein